MVVATAEAALGAYAAPPVATGNSIGTKGVGSSGGGGEVGTAAVASGLHVGSEWPVPAGVPPSLAAISGSADCLSVAAAFAAAAAAVAAAAAMRWVAAGVDNSGTDSSGGGSSGGSPRSKSRSSLLVPGLEPYACAGMAPPLGRISDASPIREASPGALPQALSVPSQRRGGSGAATAAAETMAVRVPPLHATSQGLRSGPRPSGCMAATPVGERNGGGGVDNAGRCVEGNGGHGGRLSSSSKATVIGDAPRGPGRGGGGGGGVGGGGGGSSTGCAGATALAAP